LQQTGKQEKPEPGAGAFWPAAGQGCPASLKLRSDWSMMNTGYAIPFGYIFNILDGVCGGVADDYHRLAARVER